MIDFEAIRNWLASKIWEYTGGQYDSGKPVEGSGIPVVPQNDDQPRPKYPFFTYNFIAPYTPEPGYPVLSGKTVTDEESKKWYEETRTEYPSMTLSLNAYAKSQAECMEKALLLRRFFEFDYRDDLYEYGIVVESVEALDDRTVLLDATQYEFRAGFDVVLRVTSEISRLIDFIERVEINDEEIPLE